MATNYCVYEPGTKEVLRGAFGLVILEYKAPDAEPWLVNLFDPPLLYDNDDFNRYHWQACLMDNDNHIVAMSTGITTIDAVQNLYINHANELAYDDAVKLYH